MKKKEIKLLMRLMSGNPEHIFKNDMESLRSLIRNPEIPGLYITSMEMASGVNTKGPTTVCLGFKIKPGVWAEWMEVTGQLK